MDQSNPPARPPMSDALGIGHRFPVGVSAYPPTPQSRWTPGMLRPPSQGRKSTRLPAGVSPAKVSFRPWTALFAGVPQLSCPPGEESSTGIRPFLMAPAQLWMGFAAGKRSGPGLALVVGSFVTRRLVDALRPRECRLRAAPADVHSHPGKSRGAQPPVLAQPTSPKIRP